jgi:hypothetical protein
MQIASMLFAAGAGFVAWQAVVVGMLASPAFIGRPLCEP